MSSNKKPAITSHRDRALSGDHDTIVSHRERPEEAIVSRRNINQTTANAAPKPPPLGAFAPRPPGSPTALSSDVPLSKRGPRPPSEMFTGATAVIPTGVKVDVEMGPASTLERKLKSRKVKVKLEDGDDIEELGAKGKRPKRNKKLDGPIYDPLDPPTKENAYHGRRMSDIVRGDEEDDFDLKDILWGEGHAEALEEKPSGFLGKIRHMYRTKITEKRAVERALLCAFAVSLLWATSLAVCRALMNTFISSPTFDQIGEKLSLLENTTSDERQGYLTCVEQISGVCVTAYENTRDAEILRVTDLQDSNIATLSAFNAIKTNCAANYNLMISLIESYSQESPPIFVDDFSTGAAICTGINIGAIATQARIAALGVGIAEDTSAAGSDTVANFNDQFAARVAYDADYTSQLFPSGYDLMSEEVRANLFSPQAYEASLGASMDQLQACIVNGQVGDTSAVCPDGQRLQAQIDSLMTDYQDKYTSVKDQAQVYIDSASSKIETAQALKAKIERFANSFPSGINFLLSDPWDISMFDINGLQANLLIGLDRLGVDTEALEKIRDDAVDEFNAQLEEQKAQLAALADQIEGLQSNFSTTVMGDYDPPPVDADFNETLANSNKTTAAMADDIAAELDFVRNASDGLPSAGQVVSDANSSAANLLVGAKNRTLSLFSYDDSFFLNLQVNIDKFTSILVTFDTVYRVFRSIMLVKKYWSISGILTPPADVRSDKGALFKEKKNLLQKVALLLAHPLVQMLYLALWIGILTIVIFLAYNPIYEQYVDGCVQHNETAIAQGESNGTMIYRNVLVLTLNSAYGDGDAAVTNNIDTLNLERQLSCRDYFTQSVVVRTDQNNTLIDIVAKQQVLVDDYQLFNTCINWASYDQAVAAAGHDLPSPGFSFSSTFADPTCHSGFDTSEVILTDEVLFTCVNIADCPNTCPGVNELSMEHINHVACCTLEFGVHSYFLIGLFASAMYICMNIARFYLMRGIVAIWWRRISVDLFSYLGSTTERGTIIPPKEVAEGEAEFSHIIKKNLDIALARFARNGYLEAGYALFINLPWIVSVAFVSQTINFKGT